MFTSLPDTKINNNHLTMTYSNQIDDLCNRKITASSVNQDAIQKEEKKVIYQPPLSSRKETFDIQNSFNMNFQFERNAVGNLSDSISSILQDSNFVTELDQSDPRIKEIINTYRNLIQKDQLNVANVSKQMLCFCSGLAFFDIFLIILILFIIIILSIKGISFLEIFLFGFIFLFIISLDSFLLFMSFNISESKQENSLKDFVLVFKVFTIISILI